jgi:hypothetical protein
MLKEQPSARPNIYQVLREACVMQGIEVSIKDVCSYPISVKLKLTPVDICTENPIGNEAKPTTAIARQRSDSSCYRGRVLPTHATEAGYSRCCANA